MMMLNGVLAVSLNRAYPLVPTGGVFVGVNPTTRSPVINPLGTTGAVQ